MEIKTKYNVGDSVYIMDKNKPTIRIIRRINITTGNVIGLQDPFIQYYFENIGDNIHKSEKSVFANFNEVVKHLQEQINK